MDIQLTDMEFRLLLDLVYTGNWVINSPRGEGRFEAYDSIQDKLFALCPGNGMRSLVKNQYGICLPSEAYVNGGIHEVIADYEDSVFFGILAEELARRDLGLEDTDPEDFTELTELMDEYLDEFDKNGLNSITVDIDGDNHNA